VKISEILTTKGSSVVTAGPELPVAELVQLLVGHRIGAVPVLDGNRMVGIVSERDIVGRLASTGADVLTLTARELMTVELVTCSPEDSLDDIAALMTERRIRHLPVLAGEDGKGLAGGLAGIVTIGDVVAARLRELEQTRAQLENYITQG
jgi:CBS domain-containing protein